MQAIVLGGTGQVGRNAVKVSVSLKEYSMGNKHIAGTRDCKPDHAIVTEYGRRFLKTLPKTKHLTRQCDFEALHPEDIRSTQPDTLLIALGTNRKSAGSAEVFKKIDQDYVSID